MRVGDGVARPMRRALILLAAGLVAVTSLALAPLEQSRPPGLAIDDAAFRALALINPAVLTIAAIAIGCWLAPKVALDAPIASALAERRPVGPVLRRQIGPAVIAGVAVAVILVCYGWGSRDWFANAPAAASFQPPLVSKLFYGGIAEELLLRWGMMTLLVWFAWKLSASRQPVPSWCYWAGAGIAALVFAIGHLPLLYTLIPEPPAPLIGAVMTGNAIPGVIFGWLYWRYGLETAMIAHASSHAIATAAGALVGF